MQLTESVEVALDPDTVFAYVGNPEKLPQYLPRVVAVRRDGPAVQLVFRSGPGERDTVTADGTVRLLPGRRLEFDAPALRLRVEVAVDSNDTGARVVVTLRSEDDGDYLATGRELAAALQALKRRVEGAAS